MYWCYHFIWSVTRSTVLCKLFVLVLSSLVLCKGTVTMPLSTSTCMNMAYYTLWRCCQYLVYVRICDIFVQWIPLVNQDYWCHVLDKWHLVHKLILQHLPTHLYYSKEEMYGKLPVKHSGVMLSRLDLLAIGSVWWSMYVGVIMFKCTYSALDVWSWLHKLTYKQLCIITKIQSWYHLHAAQNLSIIAEQEQRL